MIDKFLRFRDLQERGVIKNRVTLHNRIKHQGFFEGRKIGPNTRAWTESEVAEWLASRPTERKPWPAPKRREFGAA
jgi:predicted DNA-binding transcriptional regulator AlpA